MNTKIKQTLKLLLVVTLLVSLTGAAQVANVYICTGRYAKCTIPARTAKDWIIVKGKLSWFLWKRLNNKVNELVNCAIKNRENPPSPSLDA